EDLRQLGKSAFLAHDEDTHPAYAAGVKPRRPWEAGRKGLEFRRRHPVVGEVTVAAFGFGPARHGDAGFERDYFIRALTGVGPAGHVQEPRDVAAIGSFLVGEGLAQIVIATGKAEAGLTDIQRVAAAWIPLVRIDPHVEQSYSEIPHRPSHQDRDVGP